MKLLIDNRDGRGPQDYTAYLEAHASGRSAHPTGFGGQEYPPHTSIVRKLNAPAELKISLVAAGNPAMPGVASFVAPVNGARVVLERDDGTNLFTGYVSAQPALQFAGAGERGPAYSCEVTALSDTMMLDLKATPPHPPFVARAAGDAFRQLTEDILPGWFDESGVAAGDAIPYFSVDPAKKWSASAAEIGVAGRSAFRDDNGKLFFAPLGATTYPLTESDASFSPADLRLQPVNRVVNDITVLGELEPAAHVKDYFVGDGYATTFYLSQIPFTRRSEVPLYNRTILNEEYASLDPTHWTVVDPRLAISVSSGKLVVAGGTGTDGQTIVEFVEKIELGGATVVEHGDVVFSGSSDGVIGGLYAGAVSVAGCLAGFRITPSGANCAIQALVNGAVTGSPITTQASHHYVFTTQLYPAEIYRMQQVYHSSDHASGNARGGGAVTSDVRVVLEVHDIDPANPATQVAAATVLYDGVIASAPGFCTYALINAANMQCAVAFTKIFLAIDALVRSALPGQAARTRRVGPLLDGAECRVSNTPTLQFYPEYIPAANETIEVTYRGRGHAMARVMNSASIAGLKNGADDGIRGATRHVTLPMPRTAADCETAAVALLDDAGMGWSGEYQAWSKFLPGGVEDIFPGDGLAVNMPSRAAAFLGIVHEVEVELLDPGGENLRHTLRFVDAGDASLAFLFGTAAVKQALALTPVDVSLVGSEYLADLTGAEITNVTSTTVTIDAGTAPPAGGGIEVRYTDAGWGATSSGNLIGRFTTETFTLSRYARSQNYFLRSYDNSVPPKYSRYSTALHVDYPL